LEFSEVGAVELRESTGLTIHQGALEEHAVADRQYGVVTAFDVIEHCTDPMRWLQTVHSLLKRGGELHLSTMTIDNLLDQIGRSLFRFGVKGPMLRLYPEFHLYYFNLETLRMYLERAGFEVCSQTSENYSPTKASSSIFMQCALKGIYLFHDLQKKKTNQYVVCVKS